MHEIFSTMIPCVSFWRLNLSLITVCCMRALVGYHHITVRLLHWYILIYKAITGLLTSSLFAPLEGTLWAPGSFRCSRCTVPSLNLGMLHFVSMPLAPGISKKKDVRLLLWSGCFNWGVVLTKCFISCCNLLANKACNLTIELIVCRWKWVTSVILSVFE